MILVLGKTGQVARELSQFPDVVCIGRDHFDLCNPVSCESAILERNPSVVINAAAFTDVENSEERQELVTLVNGISLQTIAGTCAKMGIPIIQISSDYVFNGNGTKAWKPTDLTGPLNVYGRSKLLGEQFVCESGAAYVILRTSWIFSDHGKNFVKTMLALSKTQNSLGVIADQFGGPTPAQGVALACIKIANQLVKNSQLSGIYHLSGKPDVSWSSFAKAIFEQACKKIEVKPILSVDFPTSVKRPKNSRLDCVTTKQIFGIERPSWLLGLRETLHKLEES